MLLIASACTTSADLETPESELPVTSPLSLCLPPCASQFSRRHQHALAHDSSLQAIANSAAKAGYVIPLSIR